MNLRIHVFLHHFIPSGVINTSKLREKTGEDDKHSLGWVVENFRYYLKK